MFRVCFISSFPSSRGRLAEYAYHLVGELQRFPKISHIDIIADRVGDSARLEVNDKITLHRVWKSDGFLSLLFVPFKIFRLRPDIVHFNVHMAVFGQCRLVNFVGLSLPLLCRLLGFRTVVTLHNIAEKIDVEKAGYGNTFINRFGAFVATKLLALSSAVTLTVKSYVEVLRRKYDCKRVVWIPHGTWSTNVINDDCTASRESILYMGHSGPYKDLELLFKAFATLEQGNNGVRLIVAGDSHPNYPGFLERYESKNHSTNVQFAGYVPEDQLQPLFEKVGVVVLPYHTCTGTSGVAHLASSYGAPIIATDLPEFRELVEEGCGIVLSPHDPEAFAEKIVHILTSPHVAHELRERNLNFARKRSWSVVASRFCELYEKLQKS